MASHASCGIHPPARWSSHFLVVSLSGRRTRPSREVSAQAPFCSSHSCLWVQRCHHGPRVGPLPWTWAWACAWASKVESLGAGGAAGPGEVFIVLRQGGARGILSNAGCIQVAHRSVKVPEGIYIETKGLT